MWCAPWEEAETAVANSGRNFGNARAAFLAAVRDDAMLMEQLVGTSKMESKATEFLRGVGSNLRQ